MGTAFLGTAAPALALQLDLRPMEVAAGLRHCAGLVFLDSVTDRAGQISIIGIEPEMVLQGGDFSTLENELRNRRGLDSELGLTAGAAIGYVSYEGDFCFGFYDRLLVFDHGQQRWSGDGRILERMVEHNPAALEEPLKFVSSTSREDYVRKVLRAKEWIAAGDIYQVNVTHTFNARWQGEGFTLFKSLRQHSPAPYSAYLKLGKQEIISSSPELFLKMNGRQITTRPIKGTRPRGPKPEQDELAAHELLGSPKEVAELVMITDLERNDLGQVCEFGSVQVTELLKLERYAQVFHLVSTVQGELRADVSHPAALRACFPGGSITGAPKRRAIEIIQLLEQRERGIYTGAIGYFGYNDESQFSIAIRTVCKEGEKVSFAVGAGIVADSDPDKEYQETLHKAAGILLAAESLGNATLAL